MPPEQSCFWNRLSGGVYAIPSRQAYAEAQCLLIDGCDHHCQRLDLEVFEIVFAQGQDQFVTVDGVLAATIAQYAFFL